MAEQTAPSSALDPPLGHVCWWVRHWSGFLFTPFLCIWPKLEVKPEMVGCVPPSAEPLTSLWMQEVLFQLDSSMTREKTQQVCGAVRRGKTNLGRRSGHMRGFRELRIRQDLMRCSALDQPQVLKWECNPTSRLNIHLGQFLKTWIMFRMTLFLFSRQYFFFYFN